MDRRNFLVGATGSLAAIALAKASVAAQASSGGHQGHASLGDQADVAKIRETTVACDEAAANCVRHCLAAISAGDVALADCLSSVLRMQAVTEATYSVVSSNKAPDAPTRQLVAVCADFCQDCAAACQPHADQHPACKACLEACDHCVQACRALAA